MSFVFTMKTMDHEALEVFEEFSELTSCVFYGYFFIKIN